MSSRGGFLPESERKPVKEGQLFLFIDYNDEETDILNEEEVSEKIANIMDINDTDDVDDLHIKVFEITGEVIEKEISVEKRVSLR